MKPREIFWLILAAAAFWFLVITEESHGQNVPPVQTINTNLGIACNASGSQGAVSFCKPGWSYGCNATGSGTQILATDGNRTSIQFQNTSSSPETLTFGDAGTTTNGFIVQPTNSYLWSNMPQGNTPGRIASSAISVTGNGPCVFMFTQ